MFRVCSDKIKKNCSTQKKIATLVRGVQELCGSNSLFDIVWCVCLKWNKLEDQNLSVVC